MSKLCEIKKHKFFVVALASLVMLCGIGLGVRLYSMLNANIWVNLMLADRALAKTDKFLEGIYREYNLYHVFSKIAGTIDGGTIGYGGAMREPDGRLSWKSPENNLLAAYWDKDDAKRDEQFRGQSAQYVLPPYRTNGFVNVWAEREMLAAYVDVAIKDNAEIGNELMRIKTACRYDSEGRPEIDLSAMANVVRCYWCARMVRCAEKGEMEVAVNEMSMLIEMIQAITCGGKTEKELEFAKVLMQNALACFRVIAPKLMERGDEPYAVKIWSALACSRVARPTKKREAFAKVLHEIDLLRNQMRNEIEELLPGGKHLRELADRRRARISG